LASFVFIIELKDYRLQQRYFFFHGVTPKIIFNTPTNPTPTYENGEEEEGGKKNSKTQLVTHGDYSSVANCRTKISTIFRGFYGIFAVLQNLYLSVLPYLVEPLPRFRGTLT